MPRGSVALIYQDSEIGQSALIQIASDKHPEAFNNLGSRRRIFDRIHGRVVQTVDSLGNPDKFVNLETILAHEMDRTKEGLNDPYLCLGIQEHVRLTDLFWKLLEHDFKYINVGMLRPHVQVLLNAIESARAKLPPELVDQLAQEMMQIAEIEDQEERADEMRGIINRLKDLLDKQRGLNTDQKTLLEGVFQRINKTPLLVENYNELLRASRELELILGTISPVEALGGIIQSWKAEFDNHTKYPNTIIIRFDTSKLADPNLQVIGSEAFLKATCKNLIMNAIAANPDAQIMEITIALEPVTISVGEQNFEYTRLVVRNTGKPIDLKQAEEMNTPGNTTYRHSSTIGGGQGFGIVRDGWEIISRLKVLGSLVRAVMIYSTPDGQPPGTEVHILMMNTNHRLHPYILPPYGDDL